MSTRIPGQHALSLLVLDAADALLRLQKWVLMFLMGWVLFLILLNVATRYGGIPLYWVDEAAVYSVVWMAFMGASAMTRLRMDFAVTLLTDQLGVKPAKVAKSVSTAFVLLFGLAMLAMCWLWMDPVGISRAGFDARAYSGESFNFLYTERTQTLNWPVWVVQLILPIFALTFSLHALANLIEDLGLQPARDHSEFHVANADAVN
jgi:TRAP-type C4-dicarboxylate transport system permease small subunit